PVPGLQRIGDPVQPVRRPRLCLLRPTGADRMSSSQLSARRIAWRRRHRAFAKSVRDFRSSVPGMIGLVTLSVVVIAAIAAPLLADDAEAHANTADNAVWQTPSEYPILGTDYLGRSVWAHLVYGARVSLV